MRVVFDTNIYVSALVFPGGRADAAMQRILGGIDVLVVSPAIINEVLGVLAEKFSRDREELSRVAVLLADIGEVVKPRFRLSILPDEPDNRILEAAVAGQAAAVVTGDKALLALGTYRGIPILTLAHYLD
jgi:putative PIN family toxin of toxin-antitoxin system